MGPFGLGGRLQRAVLEVECAPNARRVTLAVGALADEEERASADTSPVRELRVPMRLAPTKNERATIDPILTLIDGAEANGVGPSCNRNPDPA